MIILFVFVIAIIVGIFYLILKTGGFLLDGFTHLFNRLFSPNFIEFSSSEIVCIFLLIISGIISFKFLYDITKRMW